MVPDPIPRVAMAILMALLASSCASGGAVSSSPPSSVGATNPPARPSGSADVVVLAAGDIANCGSNGDEATARLLAENPGPILALGDIAYPDGSAHDFRSCFDPSWGRFRDRVRPAPGNHEYETVGAAGYFAYFGPRAGTPPRGYYSFDLGDWHLISLNSNCEEAGGCGVGSAQDRWLRADLRSHAARCTLAFWHHPRFSSGTTHGSSSHMAGFWENLFAAGADIVLSAHEHNYERFAPQRPDGTPDPTGIREFVVGTGGSGHYPFGLPLPNSEVRNADAFGLLELTLLEDGYRWRFLAAPGSTLSDTGSATCS